MAKMSAADVDRLHELAEPIHAILLPDLMKRHANPKLNRSWVGPCLAYVQVLFPNHNYMAHLEMLSYGDEGVRTQALYIDGNLQHWRHPERAAVKAAVSALMKFQAAPTTPTSKED
jgi:hypothetical protein